MADAAKRRATYQDVLDAPEHLVAEIIDGELCFRTTSRYPDRPLAVAEHRLMLPDPGVETALQSRSGTTTLGSAYS